MTRRRRNILTVAAVVGAGLLLFSFCTGQARPTGQPTSPTSPTSTAAGSPTPPAVVSPSPSQGEPAGDVGVDDPTGPVEGGDAGLVGRPTCPALRPGEVDADEPREP